MTTPENPKIYHITHIKNLSGIIEAGFLFSDVKKIQQGIDNQNIGMPHIKQRRIKSMVNFIYPNTKIGEYVPFYFCPRSIMLYILYKGNHPDIDYTEGQDPILHLEFDLYNIIEWAGNNDKQWFFTDKNAADSLAVFYNSIDDLTQLDWDSINNPYFLDPIVKNHKQAEFLIYDSLPWQLVENIGVIDKTMCDRVANILEEKSCNKSVTITRNWYY